MRSKFVAICCALLPAPQTTSGKSALTAESSGCWAGGMEFNWAAASSGDRAPLATSWRRSTRAFAAVTFVPLFEAGRNENKQNINRSRSVGKQTAKCGDDETINGNGKMRQSLSKQGNY